MRRIIAIPLGDVAGIGPEIVVKTLNNPEIYEVCKPVVVGHSAPLQKAMKVCGTYLKINQIPAPEEGLYQPGTLDLIELDCPGIEKIEFGRIQKRQAFLLLNSSKRV